MAREKETCGACQRRSIERAREKERCKNNTVTEESRSRFYTGRREIKIEVSSLSRTLLKIRYGNAIGATVYNKIDVTSPVRKFQNPIKKFFSSSASVPANALSANAAAHTADVVSIWGSFENRFFWIPTKTSSSSFFFFQHICSSTSVVFFAAAGVAVIDLLVEVLFAETVVVPTTREEEEESIIRVVFIVVVVVGLYLSRDVYIYLLLQKKRDLFSYYVCSLGLYNILGFSKW